MKRSFSVIIFCLILIFSLSACGEAQVEQPGCAHDRYANEEKCEDAVYEYFCENCNETVTETVVGTGHDFAEEFTVDKKPSEHEDGQKSRHCLRCDAITDVIVLEKTNGFTFELQSVLTNEPLERDYYVLMQYTGTATQVYIPDTYNGLPVKEIGSHAFENNTLMQGVVIPDSIQFISEGAFANCTALKSVDIPDSTELYIGVFSGCTALEQVSLPANSVEINNNLFAGCTSLKEITIPASVKQIGWDAFKDCASLKTVVIPDTVEKIYGPFNGCTSLEEITIPFVGLEKNSGHGIQMSLFDQEDAPDSLKKITVTGGNIPESAFAGLDKLTTLIFGESVTSIDRSAFLTCTSLKDVTIHAKELRLSALSFIGCSALESLTMPIPQNNICLTDLFWDHETNPVKRIVITHGTQIPESFFSGLKHLEEVILPDSVVEISNHAFSHCTSLKTVKLPNDLEIIAQNAFGYCTSLKQIDLPQKLTLIGEMAFIESGLESVSIPSGEIGNNSFSNCTSLKSLYIGSGVTRIGVGAFSSSGLTVADMADGVEYIGDSAFAYCRSLTKLAIPGSVSYVGEHLLTLCEQLQSLTVPYLGKSRIVNSANVNHAALLSYYFDGSGSMLKQVTVTEGNLYRNAYNDEWIAISYGAFQGWDKLEIINLPSDLQYIGQSAFEGCTSISSISIPESVCSIGSRAFAGTGITSIRLPNGIYNTKINLSNQNGYTHIGESAFAGCPNLAEIVFGTSPTSVGAEAFAYNQGLKKVVVPNNVELQVGVFYNCTNIEELSVPRIEGRHFGILFTSKQQYEGLDYIVDGGNAWWNDGTISENVPESLKTVRVTGTDTLLNEYAFSGCVYIENIYFSDGLEIVARYAFDGCTALKTLVLPNTASDIWDYAFNHCTSLENLTFGFGMSEIGDVFYDTEKLANVYFYGTQEQWDNIIMWHLTGYLEEATVHIMGNQ